MLTALTCDTSHADMDPVSQGFAVLRAPGQPPILHAVILDQAALSSCSSLLFSSISSWLLSLGILSI